MSRRILDFIDKINHVWIKSTILLDIFTMPTSLFDHSRLHPGVILLLVIIKLKSKGDESKEDASKNDNEDTTKIVEGDSSSILNILFAVLLERKVIKYKS